ncbi:response regulator [candidate division KSB1 bacterium]
MHHLDMILVVDDELNICNNCEKILSAEGFSVYSVHNGNECLKIINEIKYDIILLDLKLPDFDGIELLKYIRDESPDSLVIIITGYPSPESSEEAMKYGAVDYVVKPFTPDELLESVNFAMKK